MSDDVPEAGDGDAPVDGPVPRSSRAEELYRAAAAERGAARGPVAPSSAPDDPLVLLADLVPAPSGSDRRAGPPASVTEPGVPVAGPPGAESGAAGATAGRPASAPSPFWRYGFPVLMVVLVALIPVLLIAGKNTLLQSTEGTVLTEITDPALPGWQAITEPTPTLLLVQTDAGGAAVGVTAMSLTGEGAGGLVFLPMSTVLTMPDGSYATLDDIAAQQGLTGLQAAVEGLLGAGMSETVVADPQTWTDLVAPVGPLTVENPDAIKAADGTVRFPKGAIVLQPSEVAAYLEATNPGESEVNRLVRHKAFWTAWLTAVGTSDDPGVLPGETESGLGRFVRDLSGDRVEMFPLPVQPGAVPGSNKPFFVAVTDQVQALVARLIPFPIGAPPGSRPRVRLLDGTGALDHGLGAAPLIVEGGGQVDQIGNATAFGATETTLTYFDDARLPEVERLQQALGVGRIVKATDAASAVDVIIVLGDDYRNAPPRSIAPVTTAPAGSTTTVVVGVAGR